MRRAVEVITSAGLGNEMFQYALGRTLALRLRRPLVMDISLIHFEPQYKYDLPCFRLGEQTVRNAPFGSPLRLKLLRKLAAKGMALTHFVDEPGLEFAPGILQVEGPCVLDGYWQSERYFESIADQLREEFTIVMPQDERSAECHRRILGAKSIGLHVRRGDYADITEHRDYHGTCPVEYYAAALEIVLARLGSDTELFVFSDDMAWARENIRFRIPTTYVDWNRNRDYEDLRLMSQCSALIMANSTFSWWGGWLNTRPDKVVVAPRNWYRAPGVMSDLPNSPWLTVL